MSEALHLKRTVLTDKSTVGELYLPDGTFACHTLEDTCRKEKQQNMTAIPAGRFEIVMAWSDRFQRLLPRLLEVPFFRGIYIHNGNYPSATQGCILVGKKKGEDAVFESVLALEEVLPKIKKLCEKGKLFIDIEGGFKADEWSTQKVV
jgi:hypothetical protein